MSKPQPQSRETYLAQIAHELRDLPAQDRADELREIEAHLAALMLASQQLDDTNHVQATNIALKQFGVPRKIGRNLWRAWERKQPEIWWRAILAPIGALAFQILALFLCRAIGPSIEAGSDQLRRVFPWTIWESSLWGLVCLLLVIFCFFAFCLLSGSIIGAISPKRSKWVVAAYFLMVLAILTSTAFNQGFSNFS